MDFETLCMKVTQGQQLWCVALPAYVLVLHLMMLGSSPVLLLLPPVTLHTHTMFQGSLPFACTSLALQGLWYRHDPRAAPQ